MDKTDKPKKIKKTSETPLPSYDGPFPSLQHFMGTQEGKITLILTDGDRSTKERVINILDVDPAGLAFRFSSRGSEFVTFSPWIRVRKVVKNVGPGRKNHPKRIGWAPSKSASSAGMYITGQPATLTTTDGSRPVTEGTKSKGVYIGMVDSIGCGYAYHEFSSTFIAFCPHSAVVDARYKDLTAKEGAAHAPPPPPAPGSLKKKVKKAEVSDS